MFHVAMAGVWGEKTGPRVLVAPRYSWPFVPFRPFSSLRASCSCRGQSGQALAGARGAGLWGLGCVTEHRERGAGVGLRDGAARRNARG